MSKNINIKKYNIKRTIIGLTLMMSIGMIGCLGSYAYFSDKAEAYNDLVVTMGNLNVDIFDEIDMDITKDKKSCSQDFTIKNNGSLKQNITLGFELSGTNNRNLRKINCSLIIDDGNVLLSNYAVNNLSDLMNMRDIKLIDKTTNKPIELKYQQELKCKITINVDGVSKLEEIQEQTIKFNTIVNATQLKEVINNEIFE